MGDELRHIEPDADSVRDSYRRLAHAYCKLIGIKPDELISDAGHEAWELAAYEACNGRGPSDPRDAEIARLTAENAQLREALERIASYGPNGDELDKAVAIADAALNERGQGG